MRDSKLARSHKNYSWGNFLATDLVLNVLPTQFSVASVVPEVWINNTIPSEMMNVLKQGCVRVLTGQVQDCD